MVDAVLTSEVLTVSGGPSSLSVDVNFGPAGQRGSYTFYGAGEPSSLSGGTLAGQSIQLLDSYINIDTTSTNYMYVYQYIVGSAWQKMYKAVPSSYNKKVSVNYSAISITSATSNGSFITYVATNTLVAGETITVSGFSATQFNLPTATTVYSATSSQFVVQSSIATATGTVGSAAPISKIIAIPISKNSLGFISSANIYDTSLSVTMNMENSKPVALAFTQAVASSPAATSSTMTLNLAVTASELTGSSWTNVVGTKNVSISINVSQTG